MDPAWIAVVISACALSVSIWTQWQMWRDRQRNALPIVRTEWTTGEGGHSLRLTIVNRINEDIYVDFLAAKGRIDLRRTVYEPGGNVKLLPPQFIAKRITLKWTIKANETKSEFFIIEGQSTPRWCKIIFSSSSNTFSRKGLVVAST